MLLYTLIGDVVESRKVADRRSLQKGLNVALREAAEAFGPGPMELQPTIGDEFQGSFNSLADLLGASLLIRLELLRITGVDCRFGLGFGEVGIVDEASPRSQDGPGWWSARAAIERVADLASAPATRFARTYFEPWPESKAVSRDESAAVNAYLTCRDAMIDRMNTHSRRRLAWLLQGQSQTAIAEVEGVTQGSVSTNLHRSGALALQVAQSMFTEPNH